MPTNYTGNATATQPPSPAPGLIIDPVAAMPNDGEVRNVSSILQPLKVALDWISWIRQQLAAIPTQISDALGVLSGASSTGIASSNANVAVNYAYHLNMPGTTVKMLCFRLTFAAGHSQTESTVITFSGATAFAVGGDNVVATLATMAYGAGSTTRPQIWAAVTGAPPGGLRNRKCRPD